MERKKWKQVIWIEQDLLGKVMEESAKLGKAPNTFITDLVRDYFSGKLKEERVIEKTIEKKMYVCLNPLCNKEFNNAKELIEHLKSSTLCKKKVEEVVK